MSNYKLLLIQKLKKEKTRIMYHYVNLTSFIGTDDWKKISTRQKFLLYTQKSIMSSYIDILTCRIHELENEE